METLSNKNLTQNEAEQKLGDPGFRTKVKLFLDQLKDYINQQPRSHKSMPSAGLGTAPNHPLVYRRGGKYCE